jgi:hypothetical protein
LNKSSGNPGDSIDAVEVFRLRREEGLGPAAIARRLGIGRASVYRVLGSTSLQAMQLGERMPIKAEMREVYPRDWPEISRRVRFERAEGICQGCGCPHGRTIRGSVANFRL